MSKGKFELHVSDAQGDSAYVYLPDHPGRGKAGVVGRQVRLRQLLPNYDGADVYFDFDKDNRLIGIDIMK